MIEEPVQVVPVESEKPSDEDLTWEDKGETIGEEIKVEIETGEIRYVLLFFVIVILLITGGGGVCVFFGDFQ